MRESSIALAILRYVEIEKCIVEGAGACGLAAIIEGQMNEFKGKKLVARYKSFSFYFHYVLSTELFQFYQGEILTRRF